MTDNPRIDPATGAEIKSHEWDGIQELDVPLPRWWLWTFYATIIFSIGYVVAYPSIPLIDRATAGVLRWTSTGALESEQRAADAARADTLRELAATPVEQLAAKPQLMRAAIEGGRAAFKVNCVQCHGSGAAGSTGYPNLNDDDWLWGGDIKAIETTLVHGIRQPGDDATHQSAMPAFGRDGLLKPEEVDQLASYVRAISRQAPMTADGRKGAALFANNCAACHGPAGRGDPHFGAPNLTDPIWLYGGDHASISNTIHNSHAGVMPSWNKRLDPTTIKMLAAYVHSLGGGK
jgi:cytochrome c oxidase cbb3-type subunit 3